MAIASPCVQECRLDEAGLACLGCLRTLVEIEAWPALSDQGKLRMLARLARRRAAQDGGQAVFSQL